MTYNKKWSCSPVNGVGDGITDVVTTGAGDTNGVITLDVVVSMRLEVDMSTLVVLDIGVLTILVELEDGTTIDAII